MKELNKCEQCKKDIKWNVNVSKKRYAKIKFCSSRCYFKSRILVNACRHCGKDIETTHKRNKQFCNIECMRAFWEAEKITCNYCGDKCPEDTPLAFGRQKFCTHQCFIDSVGKGFVVFCNRCGLPMYNRTGNKKEYKLMGRHKSCKLYKGY